MLKNIGLFLISFVFCINTYAENIEINEYKQIFKNKLDEHNINLGNFNKFSTQEAKEWLFKLQELANNVIAEKENAKIEGSSKDKNDSSVSLSLPQKEMFKKVYMHLKSQNITNPELKKIMDKTIELIEKSGVFK